MENVIKVYDLELAVEGPVYIGSGNEIAKKEYALLEHEHLVAVMDQNKLYKLLNEKKLTNKYLDFMLSNSRDDVGIWLEQNYVEKEEYLKCAKYKIDYGDASLDTHSKLSILEFVKDAYGLPYIPGSSLKGMLRTVLLAADLIKNNEEYREYIYKIKNARPEKRNYYMNYMKEEAAELEKHFYRTLNRPDTLEGDAVNDFMSGFIVSDSEPLSLEDIVLCQRIEYRKDGNEKKMNVLRETLRPGTKVHFQLSIDTSICKLTKEQIEEAIMKFGRMYYNVFLQKYDVVDMPEKNAVWLGGGTGFITKTEVYPLLGEKEGLKKTVEIFNVTKVPSVHKHNKDCELGVSPHICKMTYYNERRYQMGLARLFLSEKN